MLSARTKLILKFSLIPLIAAVMILQTIIDPQRNRFQPGQYRFEIGTEFIAATFIGLKEVVAGLLWVRSDEFFHTGNYEAIVPMVRIITWLDPHQMEIYDTGAWHLSYNFTDSQERSDRRYIPSSRALLMEGIRNNPWTYDMYTSLAWLNYQKALNFPEAVRWFKESNVRPARDPATGRTIMRPQFVGHMLAHAMVKNGQIDEAIEQWKQNIKKNKEYLQLDPKRNGNDQMVAVAENNLKILLEDKARRSKLKPVYNANFEAHWQPIGPRKFRVWGTLDLPQGTRVRMVLCDWGFKEQVLDKFSWDVDQSQTILVDDLYVRGGRFSREIDLTRDTSMYPFKAEKYSLTFSVNPRTIPDEGKDIVGWNGEGLAPNQKYLVRSGKLAMLKKSFVIRRSQIL